MKYSGYILLLFTLLLCGCQREIKEAKKVAYDYSYALANYDLSAAEIWATDETKTTMLPLARRIMATVDSGYIKRDTPAEIEIESVQLVNDTVAIAHWHKTTPIKNISGELELRKRQGKWLAHDIIK